MDLRTPIGHRDLTRFFAPLALQATAQAFSHPLVAMVASRGDGGPLNLAGLAQSGTVMFFLGIFAIYYMTTGMVYARTREGYQVFRNVCVWTGLCIVLIAQEHPITLHGLGHYSRASRETGDVYVWLQLQLCAER